MTIAPHRFNEIFKASKSETPLHNQILLDLGNAVLVPTIGSIVPNWLLLVPKADALNFRSWGVAQSKNVMDLILSASRLLGIEDDKVLWFEHGATNAGSSVGCGVDYAHLHLLIEPNFTLGDFHAVSNQISGQDWTRVSRSSVYGQPIPTNNYYAFGQGQSAFVGNFSHSLGSQFFRRVVAYLAEREQEWDYKLFPFNENIASTAENIKVSQKVAA